MLISDDPSTITFPSVVLLAADPLVMFVFVEFVFVLSELCLLLDHDDVADSPSSYWV